MPTETVIDLLRHGEPVGGGHLRGARTDDPLTEGGWSDLQRAVGTWHDWDIVATSPLARCHAFAVHLAAEPGVELVVDARLSEYDFGAWDGIPFDRLWAESGDAVAAFFGDPDSAPPPDGEAAADFRARARAAWANLLERAAGGRVLIVGHGGVLRQYVADTLGVPGNPHAALEWPHAAMSRIRVFDDPPYPQARSLVFHGRVAASEGEPGGET
jgi:broad specificity phosphatase PhoE